MSLFTRIVVTCISFNVTCLSALQETNAQQQNGFQPELISARLASDKVRPGDPISITFTFRNTGTQPANRDYRVFTHFEFPEKGCENIAIHADHVCSLPTTRWQPGKTVVDGPHLFAVPADAAEGEYFVHVGLYDFGGTGERVLDTFTKTSITISRDAPSLEQLGPKRLAADEVQQRREAIEKRFAAPDNGILETDKWRFVVAAESGAWSLKDKRTNVLWTSNSADSSFGILELANGEDHLTWPITRFSNIVSTSRSLRMTARPTIKGKSLGVTTVITAVPAGDTGALQLAYTTLGSDSWNVTGASLLHQALQVTEEDEGCYYVPHRLGIELPAIKGLPGNQRYTTYNDLSMSMCGATKQGSALLVTWRDVDTQLTIHTNWPDLPLVAGRRARSMSLRFDGASNGCLVHPLGSGDYVDIAKAYRPIANAMGWRKTWAEKRQQYPSVDRIFGAANFKPFVLSRVLPSSRFSRDGQEHVHLGFTFDEVAACAEHWRNDLEIDRAYVVLAGWINGGYDVRHPDVLPPAPECGGTDGLIEASKRIRDCGYLFGLHDNYQDMYENAPSWDEKWLNKDEDGIPKKGGNWNGGQAWQVCAMEQVELAARPETNLPAIANLFSPDIYFIDTVFAWPLVTCEDPAHPMTRQDDLRWKTNLCLLAKQHFGLFGSEEGREWAVPCADYLEGIFGHQTDSAPGDVIPLFPLVYSDCVQIMTHQGNRIAPGDEKKVADHILFAEMFLPRFGSHLYWKTDRPNDAPASELWSRADGGWAEHLGRTDRVIKNVWEVLSPLNRVTAQWPLDDHRFLTQDRLLQQTRFGPTTITVAYNKPAQLGDNVVPAYGFIVESPQFLAFCATRYNGIDYQAPTMFTVQSLDGKPLAKSTKARIYHGFGDRRVRLFDKEFIVSREEIVSLK